jgi:type I restriction enzyme R subunit
MYVKVKAEWERYIGKLRMDLSRTKDKRERGKIEALLERFEDIDMAVIVSQDQNEIANLEPFDIDMKAIRARIKEKTVTGDSSVLEEEFKDPNSNLRLVFVCAMWLTGFDVPNLSTLYLDKPLRNHTLMQAIARANRVADEGKKNGLIVDYIGVFKNIQRALALYANTGTGADDIIRDKNELVDKLQAQLEQTKKFLRAEGVDLEVLLKSTSQQKLALLDQYANTLVSQEEKKKTFLNLATELYGVYQSVLPDPRAEGFYEEVTAVRVIAARVRDVGTGSVDITRVKKDLEDLLDKSIQAGEYVIPQNKRLKDLSQLDANALHEFFTGLENKALQTETLRAELEQKITEMMKRNRNRAKFMDRLKRILEDYNMGAHDIDQLFNDLVDLARSLSAEEQRAVKENLSEEELAIFDLLLKQSLDPSETEKVRIVARELLATLKAEKLVLDWREREATRAGVKTTIYDSLYASLPEPKYIEKDCESKGVEVYNFVFEHYLDAEHFVYS